MIVRRVSARRLCVEHDDGADIPGPGCREFVMGLKPPEHTEFGTPSKHGKRRCDLWVVVFQPVVSPMLRACPTNDTAMPLLGLTFGTLFTLLSGLRGVGKILPSLGLDPRSRRGFPSRGGSSGRSRHGRAAETAGAQCGA